MAKISLRDRLRKGLFVLDGAMGTQLIAHGLPPGTCSDYLNIESHDLIVDIHQAYLRAGSDAVLTNTFGANKYVLGRYGLASEVVRVNQAGAELARRAARATKCVLGDIGPSGDFLKPLGTLDAGDLGQAFAQQALALLDGGVDGFVIETMTALDEMEVAIRAVKCVDGVPVFALMAFDAGAGGYRTMMGVDVASAVSKMVSLGVDGVGFNCGNMSLDQYVDLAKQFVSATRALSNSVLICAEPNAGKPELIDGKAVYKVTPDEFAAAAQKIHVAGVNVIGGCCGTGPEHIASLVKTLR